MADDMRTILLVDDEEGFCELVKENLELRSNFEVVVANDGMSGITIAKRIKPALILLDIKMPGLNGLEVLRRLKKDPATVAIPVVILSALTDDQSKVDASQLFDESYITKPVKFEELQNRIEEVLKRRGLDKTT